MQIMLTGRMLRAGAARGMGLVDKLVRHRDQLRWEGRKAVLQKRKSKEARFLKRIMAMGPLRDYVADKMRKEVRKKARREHYPAPYALIDLFETPRRRSARDDQGRDRRLRAAAGVAKRRPTCAASSSSARASRSRGCAATRSRCSSRVHVIGAGVMGGDIAAWCALRGMAVTLQDLDMERIKPALGRAKSLFKKRPQTQRSRRCRCAARGGPTGKGIARADVIIEAVVENLEIKRKIFAAAEKQLKPGAILATNTSSIELERIAEGLPIPSRLIGLHFFNPVAQLPLVEVIRSTFNSDHEIAPAPASRSPSARARWW